MRSKTEAILPAEVLFVQSACCERGLMPKNKWILICSPLLLRARSVRHNDWINVKIITPEKEIIKKYYIYNQQNNLKGIKGKKGKVLPPGLKKRHGFLDIINKTSNMWCVITLSSGDQ